MDPLSASWQQGGVEAVLECQHQMALERIRPWAGQMSGKPERMVTALFEKFAQWAAGSEWTGSGFIRAAVEFVDLHGHPARKAACRNRKRVEKHLVEKFTEQGLDGATQSARGQSLVLIHGNLDYIDAERHAALVQKYQPTPTENVSPTIDSIKDIHRQL